MQAMTENVSWWSAWTPEQKSKIAYAASMVRLNPDIESIAVDGVGYVYADCSVLYEVGEEQRLHVTFTEDELVWRSRELDTTGTTSPFVRLGDA
jgi:hypothetical protein